MKRLLIGGGLVAVLALSVLAVAVAGAQESTPTPSPSATDNADEDTRCEDYRDTLAENLGVSREELDAALKQTQLDMIDQAVADGKLDEDEAADLKERIENADDVKCPGFPGPRPHKPLLRGLHWLGENAAEILGLDVDELKEKVADGMSLAEIADEQGISEDDLKSKLLESAKADLDQKVEDGDLTQDQADEIYQHFSDNIDRIVNATPGDGPGFGGPGFGPGRHRGPGGPGGFPGGGPGFMPFDEGMGSFEEDTTSATIDA